MLFIKIRSSPNNAKYLFYFTYIKLIHQLDVICSINNSSYLRLQSYKLYDSNILQLRTPTKQFLHVLCYAIVFRQ